MKQWKEIQGANSVGLCLQIGRMLKDGYTVKSYTLRDKYGKLEKTYVNLDGFYNWVGSSDFCNNIKWFYQEK